jgi:hypothetical protein
MKGTCGGRYVANERGAFERPLEPGVIECASIVQLYDRTGRALGTIGAVGARQLLQRGWTQRNAGRIVRELVCESTGACAMSEEL